MKKIALLSLLTAVGLSAQPLQLTPEQKALARQDEHLEALVGPD